MRFDSTATGILDRQVGVIARRQLVDCGYRIPQIDAMLRRGHLERVAPGIYRRTGSGNTARQQEVTALLWCGDEARLTGPRLLGYLGIEGYSDRSPFTVLVPRVRRIGIEHPVRCDLAPELHDAAYGPVAGTTPARVLAEMAVGRGFDDDALLRVFDLVLTLTRGGPGGDTTPLGLLIQRLFFRYFEGGTAAAASVVLLVIGGLVALVYMRLIYREIEY
jgi:hypothetical protein